MKATTIIYMCGLVIVSYYGTAIMNLVLTYAK